MIRHKLYGLNRHQLDTDSRMHCRNRRGNPQVKELALVTARVWATALVHPDNAERMIRHKPCERARRQLGTDSHKHCMNHPGNL